MKQQEKCVSLSCISFYLNDPQLRFFCKLHLVLASFPLSFVSFHSFQFSNFKEYDVHGDYVLFQGAMLPISFSANLTGDSCTNKTSKVTNGELYMFKKFENKDC